MFLLLELSADRSLVNQPDLPDEITGSNQDAKVIKSHKLLTIKDLQVGTTCKVASKCLNSGQVSQDTV